jgi:Rne/Rng family ribonuclease
MDATDAADEDDGDDEGDEDGEETAQDDAPAAETVADDDTEEDIRPVRKPRPRKYKIQEVVKVRQIMLVQVVKEERGNKGAALTTYLSLAGRYCVLMPNTARGGGISRKITNAADRKKLKEIATALDVPQGAGLIVRTAGAKRTKAEIKRDYEYLQRQWEQVRELTLKSVAPALIYQEGDLIHRTIRDLYNRDIDEVLVEGEAGYRRAKDFMKMIMPSHAKNVKHHADPMPIFAKYKVEGYLADMFNPVVQLKSGGYIVIGVTEALVAIDVNSGRATKEGSIEETATKTNLEAAEEVARQVRLRDLAGLLVIDFIDMDERRNNAAVEKRLKDKLKTDRARIQVGRISAFGLAGDEPPAPAPRHAGGHDAALFALPRHRAPALRRQPRPVDPAPVGGRGHARPRQGGPADRAGRHRELPDQQQARLYRGDRGAHRPVDPDRGRRAHDLARFQDRAVQDRHTAGRGGGPDHVDGRRADGRDRGRGAGRGDGGRKPRNRRQRRSAEEEAPPPPWRSRAPQERRRDAG